MAQMDIRALVVQDHDKIRYLWQQFQSATTDEQRYTLANSIIRELSMHSSKEEEILYPAFQQAFGDAEQQHLLGEHHVLKQRASELSQMDPQHDGTEAFVTQVSILMGDFLKHASHEEEAELPKLLTASGIDATKLGRQFEAAAGHAVTRPHTWAPDKAPLNWFTNRVTAVVDGVADFIESREEVLKPMPQ